jgi:hypothetical protein
LLLLTTRPQSHPEAEVGGEQHRPEDQAEVHCAMCYRFHNCEANLRLPPGSRKQYFTLSAGKTRGLHRRAFVGLAGQLMAFQTGPVL